MKETNWSKEMQEWLGGMTLEEKVKTCEKGKMYECCKCETPFYDRETPKERMLRDCVPLGEPHSDCIEKTNYIILWRGFFCIIWIAEYDDPVTPEEAVIKFFKERE
jgi:hypothetical protein